MNISKGLELLNGNTNTKEESIVDELSQEAIQKIAFTKKYTVYRKDQLGKQYFVLHQLEFPYQSVIHMCDTLVYPVSKCKDIVFYPYMKHINPKPYMCTRLTVSDDINNKYGKFVRYYPSRLLTEVKDLRKEVLGKILYHKHPEDLLTKKKYKHSFINYHPLSTANYIGTKINVLSMYNFYMNSVLEMIKEDTTKEHFIHIPINGTMSLEDIYQLKNRKELPLNLISGNFHEDSSNILMMDFYRMFTDINLKNVDFVLSELSGKLLKKINIVFTDMNYNRGSILNLSTLKEIVINRAMLNRLMDHVNGLYKEDIDVESTANKNSISNSGIKVDKKLTDEDDDEIIIEDSNDNILEVKMKDGIELPKFNLKDESTNYTNITSNDNIDTKEPIIEGDNEIDFNNDINDHEREIDALIDESIIDIKTDDDIIIENIETDSNNKWITDKEIETIGSTTKRLEKDLDDLLHGDTELTPKQKDRAKKLYLESLDNKIVLNGKSTNVGKLLNKQSVYDVKSTEVKGVPDNMLDDSLKQETIFNYDKTYDEEVFDKDMINSLASLSSNGLILNEYEEEVENNAFNKVKKVKAKFNDIYGKRHTIDFKIPIVEDSQLTISGVKYNLRKQMINLPICKISDTRVSLISNYNKTLIEKKAHLKKDINKSLQKVLDEKGRLPEYNIVLGKSDYKGNQQLPSDYYNLSKDYTLISNKQYSIHFNYNEINSVLNLDKYDKKLKDILNDKSIVVGKSNSKSDVLLLMNISTNLIQEYDIKNNKELSKGTITNYILPNEDLSKVPIPNEFCHLKILDKNIPIVMILGYKFGLLNILKDLKIKHRLVTNGKGLNLQPNDVRIQFADYSLIYNTYPLKNSLLLNGLSIFNTKRMKWASMNEVDTYHSLLDEKKIKVNYLRGIDNFFNFFIDPITFDVLKEMKEPTTVKYLLLRGIEMLSVAEYTEAANLSNFRIRSSEKIPGIVYNEIARQYSQYLSNNRRDTSFSINTEKIFFRIIQDNAVALHEDINPIEDLKTKTAATHLGFGGRTEEAFVEVDRKYPSDGIGIISESTPDSGKVSINFNLSPNAKITNSRGMLNAGQDVEDLDPSSILSPVALLIPGTVNNDPKRANFISVQMSHVVPLATSETGRVRTGYESVIPQLCGDVFSVTAEQDGIILDVNTKSNLVKVKYKDGTISSFTIGDIVGDVSGQLINHDVVLKGNLSKGSKFKANEVLAYNKGFFEHSEITNQVNFKHGLYANVAFVESDTTIEDGSTISSDFADKLGFNTSVLRVIKLSTDTTIKSSLTIGDTVQFNDSIMRLGYTDTDMIETKEMSNDEDLEMILDDLQTISTKAKVNGTITKINIFYTSEKENFHPSVIKFINSVEKSYKDTQSFTKGSKNANDFMYPTKVDVGTRVRKRALDEDNLLIEFIITKNTDYDVGDKMVLGTCLKTVVSSVVKEAPVTESGIPIDLQFGSKSLFNRIVLGDVKVGILETVLSEFEKKIKNKFE